MVMGAALPWTSSMPPEIPPVPSKVMLPTALNGRPPWRPLIAKLYCPKSVPLPNVTVMVPLPATALLLFELANIVTDCPGGGAIGAVYTPVGDTVPQEPADSFLS